MFCLWFKFYSVYHCFLLNQLSYDSKFSLCKDFGGAMSTALKSHSEISKSLIKSMNCRDEDIDNHLKKLKLWYEHIDKNYTKNTARAYKADLNTLCSISKVIGINPFPISASQLIMLIDHLAFRKGRAYSSIKRFCQAIGSLHEAVGFIKPSNTGEVQLYLKNIRTQINTVQKPATSLQKQDLDTIVSKLLSINTIRSVRDACLISVMYDGLLKRSEVTSLRVEDIYLSSNQQASIILNGEDKQYVIDLKPQTYLLLRKMLKQQEISSGFIFRGIDKGDVVRASMDEQSVYTALVRAGELINTTLKFSSQSCRVGAVLDMKKTSLQDIKNAGRWKTLAMPSKYTNNEYINNAELEKFQKK